MSQVHRNNLFCQDLAEVQRKLQSVQQRKSMEIKTCLIPIEGGTGTLAKS